MDLKQVPEGPAMNFSDDCPNINSHFRNKKNVLTDPGQTFRSLFGYCELRVPFEGENDRREQVKRFVYVDHRGGKSRETTREMFKKSESASAPK